MNQSSPTHPNLDPAGELEEALGLAVALLADRQTDLASYKLVRAENLLKGPGSAGPQAWHLVFKLRSLIPSAADAEVGAGGELFVDVDLESKTARLSGYGE